MVGTKAAMRLFGWQWQRYGFYHSHASIETLHVARLAYPWYAVGVTVSFWCPTHTSNTIDDYMNGNSEMAKADRIDVLNSKQLFDAFLRFISLCISITFFSSFACEMGAHRWRDEIFLMNVRVRNFSALSDVRIANVCLNAERIASSCEDR